MKHGILFELTENCRPPQLFAWAGARGVDRFPPGCAVLFVNELSHRNPGEVRVSQELGAVEEGAAEGFQRQVHGLRRAIPQPGEVVAFEDVQNLDQDNAARGRWRCADDFVSAVGPNNRLALFHFVLREVIGGNQAPAFLDGGCQLARQGAVLEVVGIGRDALQCARQFWLAQNFAILVVVPIAQKNAP